MEHWEWAELVSLARTADEPDDEELEVSAQEYFDQQAWDRVGMSGDEFRRRLDSGEWDDVLDESEFQDYAFLARLAESIG